VRRLKYELRMLFAEWLLALAFTVAPGERDGYRLKMAVGAYIEPRDPAGAA
jgi:hypothetical protein